VTSSGDDCEGSVVGGSLAINGSRFPSNRVSVNGAGPVAYAPCRIALSLIDFGRRALYLDSNRTITCGTRDP
jgi:hypothetical protein